MRFLIAVCGWIGSAAVLIAYGLVSTNRVGPRSAIYHLLNLGGSVCLLVNSGYYGAYPSTFVNVVWSFIATFALFRAFQAATRSKQP